MMPHLARPIAANVDGLYRSMEEGAEHRANLAMEHFGLDKDEASLMKMTNMKDGLIQGDTSEIEVSNTVTQIMSAAPPGLFGFQDRGQGLSYSQLAHDTPIAAERNPGARAQQEVRKAHARAMQNSGHAGEVTSSMPALETMNPGYRRRV